MEKPDKSHMDIKIGKVIRWCSSWHQLNFKIIRRLIKTMHTIRDSETVIMQKCFTIQIVAEFKIELNNLNNNKYEKHPLTKTKSHFKEIVSLEKINHWKRKIWKINDFV